jgi:hypothetical protein
MNGFFEVYATSLMLGGLRLPKELMPIEGPEVAKNLCSRGAVVW